MLHVDLPPSVGEIVLKGSDGYQDSTGSNVALYGKAYEASQTSIVVDAQIYRYEQDAYHINILYSQEDRGKPPSSIKSPDRLMKLVLDNAIGEQSEIIAYATYQYNMEDGWNSDPIALPLTLPRPWRLARGMPFTRLDGVSFSHESGDDIPERVNVNLTDQGQIIHEIRLQRTKVISKSMILGLMREGHRLSSSLVDREKEEEKP